MLRLSASWRTGDLVMAPSRFLISALGLTILSAPGVALAEGQRAAPDESAKEMAQKIQSLLDQVNALRQRLDEQTRVSQQTKSEADAAAVEAASAKAQAAAPPAQIQNQVQSQVSAARGNTDKLYYKGVTVTLGGFLAAESIYRQHDQANDISTNFAAIPYANNSVGQTQELRFTARQSRVSALVQGSPSPQTHLGFYSEFDFQGAAQTANSNESNSYTPRLRHMYGTVDWDNLGLHLLAGQAWSLVTLNSQGITPRNEVPPPTIDGQYMPGFTWTRQPQIRLVQDLPHAVSVAVSLENPQTTFFTGANPLPSTVHLTFNTPAGQGFDSANTLSLNHIPDVVGKIVYEPIMANRHLHLEAYYLYRSFYERLNFNNQNNSGGGVGGGLTVQVVPRLLDFQISALAGKGIGRYGSAQLTDVTFDPAGNIHPIHEVEALTGLTLHVTNKWDYYLFFGEEKESAEAFNLAGAAGLTPYGYGNPLYQNGGCFNEIPTTPATACIGNTRLIRQGTTGFWFKPYVGAFGRFQYGLQYSYSQRKSFEGLGGAPTANQNIVMASMRYYPF
jgi:hypothetical protein